MTVSQLLRAVSSKELTEWRAYYLLEPFGREVDDIRQAITSKVMADVNRKKGSSPYDLKKFIPDYSRGAEEVLDSLDGWEDEPETAVKPVQPIDEQINILEQYKALYAALDRRRQGS